MLSGKWWPFSLSLSVLKLLKLKADISSSTSMPSVAGVVSWLICLVGFGGDKFSLYTWHLGRIRAIDGGPGFNVYLTPKSR